MDWKKKGALAVSVLGWAASGDLITAAPAQAADSTCADGYTCTWDGADFAGHKIVSRSTNACCTLDNYNFGWVTSYKNSNSANASIWMVGKTLETYTARTLPENGFSSDIGVHGLGAGGWLCLGNAVPQTVIVE
ncbi:peptidase inhibitor family I36 protein [Streptomyces avermitilis]